MTFVRTPFLCLLIALALHGQTATAPSKVREARTFFEERLSQRSTLIVRARFRKDESLGPLQVTYFTVTKTIRGAPTDSVGVIGIGDVAMVSRDVEKILFLKREGNGFFYSLVEATELSAYAVETEACIASWCHVANLNEPVERRQAWRRGIFEGLKSPSMFARRLASREAVQLMRVAPSWLHGSDVPSLRNAVAGLPTQDRDPILDLIGRLEAANLESYVGLEDGIPKGALRDEFLKGIIALTSEQDSAKRAAILDALSEGFARKADPLILRALDDRIGSVRTVARRLVIERDLVDATPILSKRMGSEVLEESEMIQAIECLGWLGDDSVPSVLKGLTQSESVSLSALTALGRIGSPSAVNVLSMLRRKAAENPGAFSAAFIVRLGEVMAPNFRGSELERRPKARIAPRN